MEACLSQNLSFFSLSSYLEPQFLTKIHLHFITKCVTYCKAAHNVNIITACWLFCVVFFLNISQYVVWVLTLTERVGKKTSVGVFFVEKPGDFFFVSLLSSCWKCSTTGWRRVHVWTWCWLLWDSSGMGLSGNARAVLFFVFLKKNLLVITLAR